MPRPPKSITVAELIEILQDQDPEARVMFACDYGDHHHTKQVLTIDGELEPLLIEESGYSQSGWAVVEDDGDEDRDDEARPTVLVLT